MIVAASIRRAKQPIPGINRDSLVAGLRARGHRQAIPLEGPAQLAALRQGPRGQGDYVVFLGAGSITQWAYALPDELQALG